MFSELKEFFFISHYGCSWAGDLAAKADHFRGQGSDSQQAVQSLKEQKYGIKEAFDLFDKDGSGSIVQKESEGKEIKKTIAEIDTIGNGIFDYYELLGTMTRQMAKSDPHKEMFKALNLTDDESHTFFSSLCFPLAFCCILTLFPARIISESESE